MRGHTITLHQQHVDSRHLHMPKVVRKEGSIKIDQAPRLKPKQSPTAVFTTARNCCEYNSLWQ
eukprot:536377-Pelagomonas_calceolata.AAC.2